MIIIYIKFIFRFRNDLIQFDRKELKFKVFSSIPLSIDLSFDIELESIIDLKALTGLQR